MVSVFLLQTPRLRSRAGSSSGFLDMVPPVLSLHDDVASGPTVVESEPATRDGSILSEDATTEEDSMPAEGLSMPYFLLFNPGTWSSYLTELLSPRLVGW